VGAELEAQGAMVEAQRIHQRTRYDLEMIKSMGYCHGIENYSRHSQAVCRRGAATLLDYFPRDFLLLWTRATRPFRRFTDVVRRPQPKQNLVDYGFRLPSAMDNRPLKSMNLRTACSRRFMCRRRRVLMN